MTQVKLLGPDTGIRFLCRKLALQNKKQVLKHTLDCCMLEHSLTLIKQGYRNRTHSFKSTAGKSSDRCTK